MCDYYLSNLQLLEQSIKDKGTYKHRGLLYEFIKFLPSNFKEKRRWCVSPEGVTTTIPVSQPLPEGYQWGRFYDPYKPDTEPFKL